MVVEYHSKITLLKLTEREKNILCASSKRQGQGYNYVLKDDVVVYLDVDKTTDCRFTIKAGLLVDGESTPLRKMWPKIGWLADNDKPAEWLIHDYLYGAETDPNTRLPFTLTEAQKDGIFTDLHRRLGLTLFRIWTGGKGDRTAINDYVTTEQLAELCKWTGRRGCITVTEKKNERSSSRNTTIKRRRRHLGEMMTTTVW